MSNVELLIRLLIRGIRGRGEKSVGRKLMMSKKLQFSGLRNPIAAADRRARAERARWPALKRLAVSERGVEVVEGIGMFFLLLMMGLIIWQFMVFGHQMVVTADAARQGARAAAAGYSCEIFLLLDTLPQYTALAFSDCNECQDSGDEVEVTARLQIPMVVIRRFLLTETKAVFRCEPSDEED